MKRQYFFWIFTSLTFFYLVVNAAPRVKVNPDTPALSFLEQVFQYEVLTDTSVQVGPLLLDLSRIRVQAISQDSNFKILMKWPQNWLGNTLISLNPLSGPALWQKELDPSELTITGVKNREARFELGVNRALAEQIKSPFRFCAQTSGAAFSSRICSKALIVQGDRVRTLRRHSQEGQLGTQVLINGRPVSRKGQISLNLPNEEITFQLLHQTAFMDFKIAKSPLEFDRFEYIGPNLKILAPHAKILDRGRRVETITLRPDQPEFFFETYGGIPLKQIVKWNPSANRETPTFNITKKGGWLTDPTYLIEVCEQCKLSSLDESALESVTPTKWLWSPPFIEGFKSYRFLLTLPQGDQYSYLVEIDESLAAYVLLGVGLPQQFFGAIGMDSPRWWAPEFSYTKAKLSYKENADQQEQLFSILPGFQPDSWGLNWRLGFGATEVTSLETRSRSTLLYTEISKNFLQRLGRRTRDSVQLDFSLAPQSGDLIDLFRTRVFYHNDWFLRSRLKLRNSVALESAFFKNEQIQNNQTQISYRAQFILLF